jgi:hypothetical protein
MIAITIRSSIKVNPERIELRGRFDSGVIARIETTRVRRWLNTYEGLDARGIFCAFWLALTPRRVMLPSAIRK